MINNKKLREKERWNTLVEEIKEKQNEKKEMNCLLFYNQRWKIDEQKKERKTHVGR